VVMSPLFNALRSILYGAGFVLLWCWAAIRIQKVDIHLGVLLPSILSPAGIIFMFLGAVVAVASATAFVRWGEGTPAPFDPPRKFVALGPYRYMRNPMYIGGFAVLLGLGLYLRSVSILLLSAGFLLTAHLFVITYEERHLKKTFGSGYSQYCNMVSRWIPRLR
jgi:protein-S-isoprenylcysteine O-methyltransferase Ste14